MTLDKRSLRREIKTKLQHLALQDRLLASQKIATQVIQSKIFIQSKSIACYIPLEEEVDVWSIIKTIWAQGKNCYIPTFSAQKENHLCFVKFAAHDPLFRVKYKVSAPRVLPEKIISPQNLDLVIVPLLGFNNDCFRLGRGAGSFDRTFSFRKIPRFSQPYLLGVGYECQHIEFDPEAWDIRLDEIIAE